MEIKIRTRKNITIIDLVGSEIDHKNTSLLSEKLLNFIHNEGIQYIALNMENISWLTSSGIGSLLNIRKSINKADGELCIFNINPQVLDSIRVLMIDRILPVFSNEEEAIEYLEATPWNKGDKIFDERQVDDVYILDINEKQVDLQNSGDIESKCQELISKENVKKIAINFEKVAFITSSGIGALLSIYNCATNYNAQMCIYNLSRDIIEALEISMVDKILNIATSEADAISILNEV